MALKTYHVVNEILGSRGGEIQFTRATIEAENAKDALVRSEIDDSDFDQSDPGDVEYQESLKAEIQYDEKTDRAFWVREESNHAAGASPEQAAMAFVDLKVEESGRSGF
jgi:hypothetical protein